MIAYIDSSVLLRMVLRQRDSLLEWDELTVGITSDLTRVECSRTLYRLRMARTLTIADHARSAFEVDAILRNLDTFAITPEILDAASGAFAVVVKTLDALHLATAVQYRSEQPPDASPLRFATHDV